MALALGRIGPHVFVDANGNGERDPGEKQAGVELLSSLTADPERVVRETAAFALGEIGDRTSVDTLFKFTADTDGAVAAEAVEALSKLSAHVDLPRYAALTAPPNSEGVRARAVRFLIRWNSDDASAIATRFLGDSSPAIRQEAAYALSRRGYAPARPTLELLSTDASAQTRAYAAAALGRIGAGESVGTLVNMLGDIHPWVRTNAALALSRVAAKDVKPLDRSDIAQDLARIIALSEDADPGTRATAIETVGWYALRHEIARKRLFEVALNGSRWERELAAAAIARQYGDSKPELIPADLTPWGKVRVLEVAATLEVNGTAIRKRFAADSDAMVRASAIGNIPDEAVDAEMAIIRPALDEADVIIRANAIDRYATSKNIPDVQKIPVLKAAEERARKDELNDARLNALRALGGIDYPEREAELRALLRDDDPVVRRMAADLVEEKLKKNRPQYAPLNLSRSPSDYVDIVNWSRQPHTATIHMTRGAIELVLLPQDAPITAWNFAELAKKKYFDNTTFMRVVPNFVVQGGDPRNDQNGGPGYSIRDEINLQKYTRGALGMALSGPDTGGSQFFITHSPQPHLDGGYTIFGRVYDGMGGVVDQAERGDRVETITIDEKAPPSATELVPVQRTPLPTEIGELTAERLLGHIPEYPSLRDEYKPDETVVEMIAAAVQPEDRIEIFLGTWCPDSQREVPRFLRITDMMRDKFARKVPLRFVAVDRSKTKPAALIEAKSIEKVSTFIYYRGDQELGRIVEKPNGLIEDDLLLIVSRKP